LGAKKTVVTGVGAVILFFIGLWQFTVTSRNDFAKPVLQKQLELCVEASNAAAILAEPNADLKGQTASEYKALYYGKLAVVEDRCVYQTMVNFKQAVFDGVESDVSFQRAALRIAFACRRLLSKGWNASLLRIYDPQHLLESFTDLKDYKDSMHALAECN